MQHDSIFRCIQPACGRTLPRSVNFCPYCGTAQLDEARRLHGHAGAGVSSPAGTVAGVAAAGLAGAGAPERAGMQAPMSQGSTARNDGPGAGSSSPEPSGPGPGGQEPSSPAQAIPATPPATPPGPADGADVRPGAGQADAAAWGRGPANAAGARPPPAPLPPLPPLPPSPPPLGARPQAAGGSGPMPAAPPKREPVRLRWWILALAALWGIWLLAKPSTRRIEAQMDKAMTLARECKPRDAQTELIALRKTKATPEQLQEVQKALNDAAGMCTRKRQRDKAWREAKSGVQAALAASSVERARQRLRAFTRRWGEDDQTRELKEEIDARQPEHPRADEVEGGMMR